MRYILVNYYWMNDTTLGLHIQATKVSYGDVTSEVILYPQPKLINDVMIFVSCAPIHALKGACLSLCNLKTLYISINSTISPSKKKKKLYNIYFFNKLIMFHLQWLCLGLCICISIWRTIIKHFRHMANL